ncbi:hypothetical protein D3C87_2185930 [compost metagenome]
MAEKFGDCKFLEASAKECINVEEIFLSLVRLIDKSNDPDAEEDEEDNKKGKDENKEKKDKKKKKCLIL